jgi:hypothetical protein
MITQSAFRLGLHETARSHKAEPSNDTSKQVAAIWLTTSSRFCNACSQLCQVRVAVRTATKGLKPKEVRCYNDMFIIDLVPSEAASYARDRSCPTD